MPGRRGGLSVISVVAAGGVPASRVINGTSPIRVNGGASADLSGDVTLSILPATTSQAGSMSAVQVASLNMSDPMAVFPSFGTVKGLFQGVGCTDCLAGGGGGSPFTAGGAGTGANITTPAAVPGRPGIYAMNTGTDATGRMAFRTDIGTIRFGSGVWRFRADVNIPVASDVSNTFICYAGFVDTPSSDPLYGSFFRYQYTENAGNWTCVTRNGGVETTFNSGVSAVHASAYNGLELEVDATGSSVSFYVNGVFVRAETLQIPTATGLLSGVNIRKTVGGTSRAYNVDLMGNWFNASGVR